MRDNYAHESCSNPEAATVMTQYANKHVQQLAELAGLLDNLPEGNGTVLDNTLLLWVGELADGWHGFEKWPVVMLGGQQFKGGRYHHYPSQTPMAGLGAGAASKSSAMGVPHQKLLVSVLQAFGLKDNELPVRKVFGIDNAKIDCTGPLQGLV